MPNRDELLRELRIQEKESASLRVELNAIRFTRVSYPGMTEDYERVHKDLTESEAAVEEILAELYPDPDDPRSLTSPRT